jgi:hypothetical protein
MFETLRNRFALPQGWQPKQFFKPKVILSFAGLILAAVALIWLFDKILIYFYARSYVEELAATLALNKHLATALVWVVFALTVFLFSCLVSFSRRRRSLGLAGLLVLVVGQALVLYWLDKPFDGKGVAQKCYVMTRDSIRYGERAGIDPNTGLECKPLTPEIAERVGRYAKGDRPKRLVASDNPVFFAPGTGSPIVWYSPEKDGKVEIFDLMGFHADTGEELLPITKEIAEAWRTQVTRRVPKLISDPEKFVFFDPLDGKPRAWYWVSSGDRYEFYDAPGFQPQTGDKLEIITQDVLNRWRDHINAPTTQCYILSRNGTVTYGQHPGIDPATGRECRPIKPELVERLKAYEAGKRPRQITDLNPVFFDPRSSEPIVWYYQSKDGSIEIFDLMGFHADTGEELLPITKEIAKQVTRRVPKLISDPEKFVFFDPLDGKPRAWLNRPGFAGGSNS